MGPTAVAGYSQYYAMPHEADKRTNVIPKGILTTNINSILRSFYDVHSYQDGMRWILPLPVRQEQLYS